MSLGYDFSCTTLSQEGRIYQLEYALKAIESASTALGIVCKDGVILASEKIKQSKTIVSGSNPTIYHVTKTIGIGVCGHLPDGRNLVSRAKSEASSYLKNFGVEIEGRILAERLSLYVHSHTIYWTMRPFGAVAFVSTYSKDGPHLYMIENNGSIFEYYSASHGKGRQYVKTDIEKNMNNFRSISCKDAVVEVLKVLVKSYEGEKETEYDISVISEDTNFVHQILERKYINELTAKVKLEVDAEREERMD